MTLLSIGEGMQVTLHFALTLNSGEVIDSTFEKEPAQFTFGDGNLLEGFEKSLIGLTEGAKETFTIEPEAGFGQSNPNNVQYIRRDQFGDNIALEEGLMLSFADAQNTELPGVVTAFDDKTVTVDFNHPLAGKEIQFEVEIIAVAPATKH
ncbi:MAG: FKBP-type peptidyl-prolyl cis-trans isomerase SlpA [Cellvibrionaceae bacterium]|jgi:FKBP-type peptidyl-prolyl cis-trans isomerase SlpA